MPSSRSRTSSSNSTVPDDPYLGRELGRYFPKPVSERFPDGVTNHRLRREIIATQLANSMINRGGPSLVVRIADQTGASAVGIAAAFAAVRDSFGMTTLNGAIDALDARVNGALQLELYAAVQDLLLDRIVWFLRNVDLSQGLAGVVDHYRSGDRSHGSRPSRRAAARSGGRARCPHRCVDAGRCPRRSRPPYRASAAAGGGAGCGAGRGSDGQAGQPRSRRPILRPAPSSSSIASSARRADINVADYFDRLALDRALDSIGAAERRLAAEMVANGAAGPAAVEAWVATRQSDVNRIRGAVDEIAGSGLTLSKLSVAASLLGDLVRQ